MKNFICNISLLKWKWDCQSHLCLKRPHQWPSGSTLKTGRREVQCLIPGRACRPSLLEFFVGFFLETPVNTGQDLFEIPHGDTPFEIPRFIYNPISLVWQLDLKTYNQQTITDIGHIWFWSSLASTFSCISGFSQLIVASLIFNIPT